MKPTGTDCDDIKPNPEVIWLSPQCDVHGDGRMWCEDAVFEQCETCGALPARYVLADK